MPHVGGKPRWVTVEGYVFDDGPVIAIHPELVTPDGGRTYHYTPAWQITHLPTGMTLIDFTFSKERAARVANRLVQLGWNHVNESNVSKASIQYHFNHGRNTVREKLWWFMGSFAERSRPSDEEFAAYVRDLDGSTGTQHVDYVGYPPWKPPGKAKKPAKKKPAKKKPAKKKPAKKKPAKKKPAKKKPAKKKRDDPDEFDLLAALGELGED